MPLFTHQTIRKTKGKKQSIGSRLKRLFHKAPSLGIDGGDEFHGFIDKFRVMFLRSMVVLMAGCSWWVATPAIFLSLLPGFQVYRQWITNAHYTVASVYLIWQVVPLILLFGFATLWTSGVLDMIIGNEPLEKVF